MDFHSAYAHGFVRVAAVTIPMVPADPVANAAAVIEQAQACHADGVGVAVFPELCLSGYSADDLFGADALLDAVRAGLDAVVAASRDLTPVLIAGAPIVYGTRLLNTAFVIHRGAVLGIAVKSYLPTYREFYERRWFAPGDDVRGTYRIGGTDVPIGPDLLFAATDLPNLVLGVEICEDMWVPVPPSAQAALAGATVLAEDQPPDLERAGGAHPVAPLPGGPAEPAGQLGDGCRAATTRPTVRRGRWRRARR